MIIEIFINGNSIDLYEDANFSYTVQVNDIFDVKDRQSSFTNSFSVPKTSKNIRILNGLGITSNISEIPYQKQDCRMKIDGYDLIIKGWLNITEVADEFKINIYNGIINFFKAIENKTIGNNPDIDLSEINHDKTLQNIVNSFDNDTYKYLIADYNGKLLTQNNNLNIDYLVPSVNAKYLWDKIHESYGFTYTGSIIEELKNKWITYSKGIDVDSLIVENANIDFNYVSPKLIRQSGFYIYTDISYSFFKIKEKNITKGSVIPYGDNFNIQNPNVEGHYIIDETAFYKIEITGNINMSGTLSAKKSLHLIIDGINKTPANAINNSNAIKKDPSNDYNTTDFDCTITLIRKLNAGSSVALGFHADYFAILQSPNPVRSNDVNFKISKIESQQINFSQDLEKFKATDFVKSIMVLYGITAFTNEFTNEIKYLTISEKLNADSVDWTNKYIKRNSETFVFNNYAQNNIIKYKYTEESKTYNDGKFIIENQNLDPEKVIYDSPYYSPEIDIANIPTVYNFVQAPIMKLWDKDIKDDGTVSYKAKDSRFFLVTEILKNSPIVLESGTIPGFITASPNSPFATLANASMQNFINRYYADFRRIVQHSVIHTIDLNLTLIDIITLDLNKVYYFQQEQQYYILNKLTYKENGSSGEFVRINKGFIPEQNNPRIYITDIISDDTLGQTTFNLHVEDYDFSGYLELLGRKIGSIINTHILTVQGFNNTLDIHIDIPNSTSDNQDMTNNIFVQIPIGIYHCFIGISGISDNTYFKPSAYAKVSYKDNNNNVLAYAEAYLNKPRT